MRRFLHWSYAEGSDTPRRRRTDAEPTPGWRPVITIIVLVAALDWVTKAAVAMMIPVGGMVEMIPDRIALIHVQNPAMMLGLWGDLPIEARRAIAAAAAVLVPFLVYELLYRGHRLPASRRWAVWAFVGLAAGGMLGNLGERAVHWSVTDFLSIGLGGTWLPPGNIADLAILLAIPFAIPAIVFELLARSRRGTFDRSRPSEPSVSGQGG